MKILIRVAAILLLLRILGEYAQAMPSLSLALPTEKPKMDSAEAYPVDIAPADFVAVEFIAP